jgi:hypothetical protein
MKSKRRYTFSDRMPLNQHTMLGKIPSIIVRCKVYAVVRSRYAARQVGPLESEKMTIENWQMIIGK